MGATSLAKISRIKQAIERAQTVEEAVDLRDQSAAIVTYAKAISARLEVVNAAVESKLRSERKAGELLAGMNLRGGDRKSNCRAGSLKLSEIGISHNQSSRWQSLASLPPDDFESYVSSANESGKEITSTAAYKLAKQRKKRQPKPKIYPVPSGTSVVASLEELEGQQFGTIYADPPWKYGNQGTRAATSDHYDTMTVDDLCEMPVADHAADDAHLHLWTTNAFLHDAFRVIDAWGFEYRSCFVWVKPQMGIGNYWRVSHEFLLLGIRGKAKRFNDKSLKSWGEFDRGKHSAKPEQVREFIERASPGPYLEMFGRAAIEGWTVMGNQVEEKLFA